MQDTLYVGVDAHKKRSHVAVMDQGGTVLKSVDIPSSRSGVAGALGRYKRPIKAVLEASYAWEPMHDWLDEFADEVVLAHPLKVRAIADARIKTDKLDARVLAHLLRADLIPPAYVPNRDTRRVKRVLRQRCFLIRVRTMVKNRIAALLAWNSVQRPDVSTLYGKVGRAFLSAVELPEVDRSLLNEDLELLDAIQQRVAATENLIAKLSKGDPIIEWLSSLPGIGDFFAVLLRYEIDEISRFRTPKKLASYVGIVPSVYQSANRCFHGRLTKQGNKHLRWAMIEAVTPAIRHSPYFRRYYERIKRSSGSLCDWECTRTGNRQFGIELARQAPRHSSIPSARSRYPCVQDRELRHLCSGVSQLGNWA